MAAALIKGVQALTVRNKDFSLVKLESAGSKLFLLSIKVQEDQARNEMRLSEMTEARVREARERTTERRHRQGGYSEG